ncbi:MAG: cytochrome c biogenesis protein CcsA [Flammeovirgaceae bacterium]
MQEIHTGIGSFGHQLVIVAFVAALVAAIAYIAASQKVNLTEKASWNKMARWAYYIHGFSVLGVVATLFTIIYNHYFEYHYAWSHASVNLPTHYMISCFWEGQEGSFLLWAFWHVLIGSIVIKTAKHWENHVMGIFMLVQAFLLSMILGVVPINLESLEWALKLGSDPFILLRDALPNDPTFKVNPNFVPEDGTGLNPLLQNYWMVIHPPTLFLGFALTLVPFAYCMAGLQTKQYSAWIKPALSWSLVGALVLGIGIMMGAYWAYETLNFGGYWNWDPVENAVYIPWLTWVAAIHLMAVYQRTKSGLHAGMILIISTFVLILYSTFLVRSGILGESSVHSFTDLGLSGQLLVYLLFFAVISVGLLVWRWKSIPATNKELSVYTSEFWIFIGALVLCMSAFQVLMPTSIPVFNAIMNGLGIESKAAPPADQVEFYTKWQLWFGLTIAVLSATGQVFWWKRVQQKKVLEVFALPLMITFVTTTLIIIAWGMSEPKFIALLLACVYSIVTNGSILIRLLRSNAKLSGGAVAHLGIALMLVGMLFSAGYNKVISVNTSGLLYSKEFSDEMNKKNWLLFRDQPMRVRELGTSDQFQSDQFPVKIDADLLLRTGIPNKMLATQDLVYEGKLYVRKGDTVKVSLPYYEVTYKGPRMESEEVPGYINQEDLIVTTDLYKRIAKKDIVQNGKVYKKRGDTLHVYGENTYFEIDYRKSDGSVYTLYPRIQDNERMGLVPSPDISTFWNKDVYMHVTNMPDPDQEEKWSEPEEHVLVASDTFILNDYIAILDGVRRISDIPEVTLGPNDAAVEAQIRILGREDTYYARPIFMIKDGRAGSLPEVMLGLGLRIAFTYVDPQKGEFTFSVSTSQRDWVILNALEKPFINLLWIGTIVMGVGFGIATARRFREQKKSSDQLSEKLQEEEMPVS